MQYSCTVYTAMFCTYFALKIIDLSGAWMLVYFTTIVPCMNVIFGDAVPVMSVYSEY